MASNSKVLSFLEIVSFGQRLGADSEFCAISRCAVAGEVQSKMSSRCASTVLAAEIFRVLLSAVTLGIYAIVVFCYYETWKNGNRARALLFLSIEVDHDLPPASSSNGSLSVGENETTALLLREYASLLSCLAAASDFDRAIESSAQNAETQTELREKCDGPLSSSAMKMGPLGVPAPFNLPTEDSRWAFTSVPGCEGDLKSTVAEYVRALGLLIPPHEIARFVAANANFLQSVDSDAFSSFPPRSAQQADLLCLVLESCLDWNQRYVACLKNPLLEYLLCGDCGEIFHGEGFDDPRRRIFEILFRDCVENLSTIGAGCGRSLFSFFAHLIRRGAIDVQILPVEQEGFGEFSLLHYVSHPLPRDFSFRITLLENSFSRELSYRRTANWEEYGFRDGCETSLCSSFRAE